MSFHKNLYNEIQDNDMKIKALSKKTGIKRQQLYRYYTGKTEPKIYTAKKICDALGKTIDEMLK